MIARSLAIVVFVPLFVPPLIPLGYFQRTKFRAISVCTNQSIGLLIVNQTSAATILNLQEMIADTEF